jgi:hypothetical protein
MNKEVILGFVRHVLTFAGGFAASSGLVTSDELTAAVAAVVTLAGIVWSALDKKKA